MKITMEKMRLFLPASYKYIRILSGDSINLSRFFHVFYQIVLSQHRNCSEYFVELLFSVYNIERRAFCYCKEPA